MLVYFSGLGNFLDDDKNLYNDLLSNYSAAGRPAELTAIHLTFLSLLSINAVVSRIYGDKSIKVK